MLVPVKVFYFILRQNQIVSHRKERKEKICLNCAAELQGRYCHVCGQENTEPRESFWHLVTHFVEDVTHFDGKFFKTLRYLLFRPGYLSAEYARGRRASYLNPIRMYIFTSAIFFIVFSWHPDHKEKAISPKKPDKESAVDQMKTAFYNAGTPAERDSIRKAAAAYERAEDEGTHAALDSNNDVHLKIGKNAQPLRALDSDYVFYYNLQEYDSVQQTLPENQRDDVIERYLTHRSIELDKQFKGDSGQKSAFFVERFVHYIPKALVVCLPFIALILWLLYRRRKQFYYVNHVIFVIDYTIATFILILLASLFNSLLRLVHLDKVTVWVNYLFTLLIFIYLYAALYKFYGQGKLKTFLKYLLLLISTLLLFAVIAVLVGLLTFVI
jgi:hypothetical protein